jgi:hypothetical protein
VFARLDMGMGMAPFLRCDLKFEKLKLKLVLVLHVFHVCTCMCFRNIYVFSSSEREKLHVSNWVWAVVVYR